MYHRPSPPLRATASARPAKPRKALTILLTSFCSLSGSKPSVTRVSIAAAQFKRDERFAQLAPLAVEEWRRISRHHLFCTWKQRARCGKASTGSTLALPVGRDSRRAESDGRACAGRQASKNRFLDGT